MFKSAFGTWFHFASKYIFKNVLELIHGNLFIFFICISITLFSFALFKTKSKNDVDGALNKYKLIDTESQKGAEIWNNVGLCFYKKKKFIAVLKHLHSIETTYSNQFRNCSYAFWFLYPQAISCLKKAIWIEPINFNCLFNLGLVYLTAQQFASAFHTLAAAACIRLDNAECYMLLGSKENVQTFKCFCFTPTIEI